MSLEKKVLLFKYYNPTVKINFRVWKVTRNGKREIRVTLTPAYLWKVINRI